MEENVELNRTVNKKRKEKKLTKKKKVIIIISVILFLIVLLTTSFILMFLKQDKVVEEIKVDERLSEKEYKAIVDAYGEASTVAIHNYIVLNNGNIPAFEDVKSSVIFDTYEVSCTDSIINYDGSLYLSKCTIDGEKYDYNYSYGKKLNEPQKTGDKIYIFKTSYSYTEKTTGKIINQSYYSFNKENTGEELVGTYECYNNDCVAYDYDDINNAVLVHDGNYFLYDLGTGNKQDLDLGNTVYNNIRLIKDDNKIYGLSITNDSDKYAFYSIKSNKFLTNFEYSSMYSLNSLLNKNYFIGEKFNNGSTTTYIMSIIDGSIVKTIPGSSSFTECIVNNVVYYYSYLGSGELDYRQYIYNSNFDKIINGQDIYSAVVNKDNTISVLTNNNKNYYIYDLNGNLLRTSEEFKKVVIILQDYVVVVTKNNHLNVLTKDGQLLKTLAEITDNNTVHSMLSGWYNENGKNGIYVVVEDNNIPYGTKGSGLEYYYIPQTNETGVIKKDGVGGYAKPVLYLYPTKKTEVTVSFEKPSLLTTTYPKYVDNWKVTAYKNGDLYDTKGNYYYGLYWEESGSTEIDFKTGFYVTKENSIEFLEEKLTKIGLNARERNEFIMYWLPILEKNNQSLVYFELTNERQKYNKIKITPKPDSLLRVAIHVKKVKHPTEIKEQKLSTFKRSGFTAVEWGGVIHK